MKKIILLMLLAFSSTTFVYADELNDKITAYQNIITQISDNITTGTYNEELHITLKQLADNLMEEIKNISGISYVNLFMWKNNIFTTAQKKIMADHGGQNQNSGHMFNNSNISTLTERLNKFKF